MCSFLFFDITVPEHAKVRAITMKRESALRESVHLDPARHDNAILGSGRFVVAGSALEEDQVYIWKDATSIMQLCSHSHESKRTECEGFGLSYSACAHSKYHARIMKRRSFRVRMRTSRITFELLCKET